MLGGLVFNGLWHNWRIYKSKSFVGLIAGAVWALNRCYLWNYWKKHEWALIRAWALNRYNTVLATQVIPTANVTVRNLHTVPSIWQLNRCHSLVLTCMRMYLYFLFLICINNIVISYFVLIVCQHLFLIFVGWKSINLTERSSVTVNLCECKLICHFNIRHFYRSTNC